MATKKPATNKLVTACEFYRLFTKNVPHILEKIFFSLDYASFKNCLEVSKSWRDLLTSESFLSRGKSVFCEDIKKDLLLAVWKGNVDLIKGVLSSFMVDINFTYTLYTLNMSPLILAAWQSRRHVVQLLLDRGAEPNMAAQNGMTPLSYALQMGHMDVANILTENGGTTQKK